MANPYDFARSTSQRRTLRKCGYLYTLQYGEHWKAKAWRGTYAFGTDWQTAVEALLKGMLTDHEQFTALFQDLWALRKDDPRLTWKRATWELLKTRAPELARVAVPQLLQIVGQPGQAAHYDRKFQYLLNGKAETVIPDYVGPCRQRTIPEAGEPTWGDQVWSVLDWKTSDRRYNALQVEGDEQLTDYQIGSEEEYGQAVHQVGLVVFIYATKPEVQWLVVNRRDQTLIDQFIAGATVDNQRIEREEFAQNRNACFAMGTCDMVPICYPSQRHRIPLELDRFQPEDQQAFRLLEEQED